MIIKLLRIARVSLIAASFAVAFVAVPKLDGNGLLLAVTCGALSVVCHLAVTLLEWNSTWG